MRAGYFFSDEPGYYEEGLGGVRLETILMTVAKNDLKYGHKNYNNFLGFEPVCLVPFEPKLIDYKLLSNAHIDWLNHYNNLIRTKVGSELKKQGKAHALKWMESRIKLVAPKKDMSSSSSPMKMNLIILVLSFLIVKCMV